MICIGLMLLCLTSVLSTLIISNRSYSQLQETTENNVQALAKSIDETLTDYVSLFEEIGRKCIETSYTYESVISSYFTADKDSRISTASAIDMLNGYAVSMPLLGHISIYYHASDKFLYASYSEKSKFGDYYGTIPAAVYCRLYLPELDQTAFVEELGSFSEGRFFTTQALLSSQKTVYITPIYIRSSSENRRAAVFIINQQSIDKAFHGVLGSLYEIDSISYKGTCIYTASTSEDAHCFTYDNPGRFSVTLRMPETTYSGLFSGYSKALTRFGIVSAILCAGMIAFFILFTYKPLNQIVNQTGSNENSDEISSITKYIARKETLETELRAELDSEKEQIRLHSIEMLLLGIPTEQIDYPDDDDPYHFVAISPLSRFSDINETIRILNSTGHILPYEQFRSGQLVMIVGSADMDNMEEEFRKWFNDHFGSRVELAIGSICTNTKYLHRSFLDALLNMNKNSESVTDSQDTDSISDPRDVELFRAQIIANDASCVDTVARIFKTLDHITPSFLYYWHSYCKTIEQLGGILKQYGYSIHLSDYLKCMTEEEIKAARVRFLEELGDIIGSGPVVETKAEHEYGESIIQFINDNLSNETFGIPDIIDCFNLSEYTITKLIRDQTNMTFKRYLTHVRLEQAKQLLGFSQDSIQDIASQCGFSSSSYFIRVFKAETNVTPLQYRMSLQS
ncbi:MAG: AraC family transcriptional regulator [Clostridia bacterium]|nr:AraC family transcriptional regulator [Clostridia bacterium]